MSFQLLICNWRNIKKFIDELENYVTTVTLREKCPTTELFLVRIFLYSDWIQENTDQK